MGGTRFYRAGLQTFYHGNREDRAGRLVDLSACVKLLQQPDQDQNEKHSF